MKIVPLQHRIQQRRFISDQSQPTTTTEPLDGEEYLDISGIMRNQAGRYECKASNDVATPDVKYVNVVVNYPPAIKKTQNSETQVGHMGKLLCDATAVPTPEFEWYRDDKSLISLCCFFPWRVLAQRLWKILSCFVLGVRWC
ncbi:hypothetical protein NHX12_008603 [Muraenolepis orangiensis]|uniref:Ig-like domain-containing protein n=1 Tax=Muraenolepis orangiensis TaxID=630683 RepID=A0A9Q0DLL7_9TELE|nr:hypothetical protein NHX12_008603 [Muraenolepis orangiensis]